jgi:hypothetical protein
MGSRTELERTILDLGIALQKGSQDEPDNVRRTSSGGGSMVVAGQKTDTATYAPSRTAVVKALEKKAMELLTAAVDDEAVFKETARSIRRRMQEVVRRHGYEDEKVFLSDHYVLSCERRRMLHAACLPRLTAA